MLSDVAPRTTNSKKTAGLHCSRGSFAHTPHRSEFRDLHAVRPSAVAPSANEGPEAAPLAQHEMAVHGRSTECGALLAIPRFRLNGGNEENEQSSGVLCDLLELLGSDANNEPGADAAETAP